MGILDFFFGKKTSIPEDDPDNLRIHHLDNYKINAHELAKDLENKLDGLTGRDLHDFLVEFIILERAWGCRMAARMVSLAGSAAYTAAPCEWARGYWRASNDVLGLAEEMEKWVRKND